MQRPLLALAGCIALIAALWYAIPAATGATLQITTTPTTPRVSLPFIAGGSGPTATASTVPTATAFRTPTATSTTAPTATPTVTNTAPPATPTSTATATPLPDLLLPNGSFETDREPWIFSGGASRSQSNQHTGLWNALLGNAVSGSAIEQQLLTVPADRPYLTYWDWRTSFSTSCDVVGRVLINGATVQSWMFCQAENGPGLTRRSVDLSALAGQ